MRPSIALGRTLLFINNSYLTPTSYFMRLFDSFVFSSIFNLYLPIYQSD